MYYTYSAMSTMTITSPAEVAQLRKDLAYLAKRNERQFHIIEYLIAELKALGRDIDVLDIDTKSDPVDAVRTWAERNHSLEADLEMLNKQLVDRLSDREDEAEALMDDIRRCMSEIRRLNVELSYHAADDFFRTLSGLENGGAK